MIVLFKIMEFLFTFLEIEMACILCNSLFQKKWSFSFRILELGALCCIGLTYCNKLQMPLFSNMAWIVNIALLFFLLKACYRVYWYEASSILMAFYAMLFSLDFLIIIMICMISHDETLGINMLHGYSWKRSILLSILRSVDLIVTVFLIKNRRQILRALEQTGVLLVLLGGICFYFMVQLQNVQIKPVNFNFLWTYAGDVIGILGIGCIYSLWAKHQIDEREKFEFHYLQQNLLQSFAHAKTEMSETSQKLHDEKSICER